MAQLTINLPNNETATIPDWTLETTMNNMAKDMAKISKTIEEENKKLIKAITGGTGSNSTANSASTNTKEKETKATEEHIKTVSKTTKEYSNFRGNLVNFGGAVGGVIGGIVTGVGALTGAIAALTTGTMLRYTSSLNRLTDVGLNQADEFMETNFALRRFGMSLVGATDFTLNTAQAMQALGGNAVTGMLQRFDALNASGADFGLTLQDNMKLFEEELVIATRLGNIGRLSEKQQQSLATSMTKLIKTQITYSGALGESVDVVRTFTLSLLNNASDFQSRLLLTNEATRQEMLKGAQEFVSVLRATGGTLGGELAAAALEAASFGAIGFSDSAKRFITVLPGLSGSFNMLIKDFNQGLIDGEEVAMAFTEQMATLSRAEKNRIFAIARTGDQQALVLAKGVMQFEKSFTKIQKMGDSFKDIDPVQFQRTLNLVQSSGTQLIATVGAVKDKFITSLIKNINYDDFNNSFKAMKNAIQELANTFFGIESESEPFAEMFAKKIPMAVDVMTIKIGMFNDRVKAFLDENKDAGFMKTFTDVVKPALVKLFDMISLEFGVLLHSIGLRMADAFVPFVNYSEQEIEQKKKEYRNDRAMYNLQKYSFSETDNIARSNVMINPDPNSLSLSAAQSAISRQTNEYGKVSGGFIGDFGGQRFLNTPGTGGKAKVVSLGSTQLSTIESQQLKKYMEDGKVPFKVQQTAGAVDFGTATPGGGDFKQSFDQDGVEGLSNQELKTYFETLILLARKQVKVVEEGNM